MNYSAAFEEPLVSFLDNASIGVHIVDSLGIVKYANAAELALLKIDKASFIGQNIRRFHLDKDIIEGIFSKLSNKERVLNMEARLLAADGTIKHVLINSSGFYSEEGLLHTRCFTTDITTSKLRWIAAEDELKRKSEIEQQLKLVEKKFKTSLSSGLVGVWTSDLPRGLIFPDEYITRIFGLEPSDDGIPITFLETRIHPEDQERATRTREEAIAKGKEYVCEFRIITGQGATRWVLARGLTEYDNTGQPLATSGTFMDITDQKEFDQQKDEFLSIASHEFKTPLTALKGYLQILDRSLQRMQKEQTPFLGRCLEQVGKLERLTADLLDVSKISAGKLVFSISEFKISEVIYEVVENSRLVSKSHEIIVKDIPSVLYKGDKHRIEQVINNFISNAIKYSPKGDKVIIDSYLSEKTIVISVQDFGIGIEPDHINKLFQRFYRASNATLEFEGLGLGLFIVAEIIKGHGGELWAESELGKGSTFFIKLPLS